MGESETAPPFYAAVPHFWTFGAPPPRTNGHVAWTHGGVLKKALVNLQFCMWAWGSWRETSVHTPYAGAPTLWWPKRPFLPNSGRFPEILLVLRHTECGLLFLFRIHQPHAELDIDGSFFQDSSVGPSYVAIRTGWWRPDHPKIADGCVKKGGGFSLSPQNTYFIFI